MNINDTARHCAQAAQLLRLRTLRQQQAEAALRSVRAEHAQALAAVRQAQARLDAQRVAQATLLQALGSTPGLPRVAAFAEARREAVAELLERAEYTLIDEEESLQAADHALMQAGLALRQALARRNAADEAVQRAGREHALAREQRAEREEAAPARP